MKIYFITLTYLDLPLLQYSLNQFYSTMILKQSRVNYEHILLDHHWPIDPWAHRKGILNLAQTYDCKVMTPYQNMGGHGGFNWVLKNIPIQDDDIVITYDGDSNPQTQGWDMALVNLLLQDPTYAWVSLFLDADLSTKHWTRYKTQSHYDVVRPAHGGIEMMNVTAWRYSFLKQVGLMQAHFKYYGQVEVPMHSIREKLGMKWGYLADYIEKPRPFNADPRYQAWKHEHVCGKFPGNFDEYLRQIKA